MRTALVRIGNSRGVRIPKSVIEQCGFKDLVDMTVENGVIRLAPAQGRRRGWDAAFKAMADAGDDTPLLPDNRADTWDETEWKW